MCQTIDTSVSEVLIDSG